MPSVAQIWLLAFATWAPPTTDMPSADLHQRTDASVAAEDSTLREARAQVARTLSSLFVAAERGDMAALDTLYSGDSLTVIEGAGINRTWGDYREHHLGPELKEMKELHYRPADIEVHLVGSTAAWAIFRYSLTAVVEGRSVDIVGRGTAIFERHGGRWIVRHTHTSGRARRPADPVDR